MASPFQVETGKQPLGGLGGPLVALHYLRVKSLGCHLLGHLRHAGHSYFHRCQSNGQLPGLMIAVAVTSKLPASGITVATQEGIHFLLQDHRQHLPGPFPNVTL